MHRIIVTYNTRGGRFGINVREYLFGMGSECQFRFGVRIRNLGPKRFGLEVRNAIFLRITNSESLQQSFKKRGKKSKFLNNTFALIRD